MVDVTILNTTTYSRTGFVTVGIPFPSGELMSGNYLVVDGSTSRRENVQWYPQGARWGDNSVKYARATFPTSIGAGPYTDKSVSVFKTTSANGASSTFTVPRQTDISATRFQLSYKWKEFYKPSVQIVNWEAAVYPGTAVQVIKVTYRGDAIKDPEEGWYSDTPLYNRERTHGIYDGIGFGLPDTIPWFYVNFTFAGYSTGYNFGVYGGIDGITSRVRAVKGGPGELYIFAYVATFPGRPTGTVAPNLTLDNRVNVGVWTPQVPANAGVINLDLSTATLVEGDGSSSSHYRRWRVFARGDNSASGLPGPIWAEVVYNVYKNSDYIEYWFSWGNSWTEVSTGNPRTNGNSATAEVYKRTTFWFEGPVELKIYSLSAGTLIPRVSVLDSEYQLIRGPTESGGVTTCVMLDSNDKPYYTYVQSGRRARRVRRDIIHHGMTIAHKGYVVYQNTLTDSSRALLTGGGGTNGDGGLGTGREIYAIADWQGSLPPYKSVLPMPDYVSGISDAKTRTKRMTDERERKYLRNNPLQISAQLGYMAPSRTTVAGDLGELFNTSVAGYCVIATDPYPLRLMSLCVKKDMLRAMRQLKANGDNMRYLDHYISPTAFYYTDHGLPRFNSSTFIGKGPSRYNLSNTLTSSGHWPAPQFCALTTSMGQGAMDMAHGTPECSTRADLRTVEGWVEDAPDGLLGYKLSHWSGEFVIFYAFATMDYHAIRHSEQIQIGLWTEGWSGSRGSRAGDVDPGGKRTIETRTVSRPLIGGIRLLELLGPGPVTVAAPEGEYLAEIKAHVRRIQSGYVDAVANQPGHLGYRTSELYGDGLYATKMYPYSQYPPELGALIQEWGVPAWQDWMAIAHFWGMYKTLVEHGATTEMAIALKLVKDLSAYILKDTIVHTNDYTTITFFENGAANFNSPKEDVLPYDLRINDVLRVDNTGVTVTVKLITIKDTTEYYHLEGTSRVNTNYLRERQSPFACIVQIHCINRTGPEINTYVNLTNVRTGQRLRIGNGTALQVRNDLDNWKIAYIAATSPDPSYGTNSNVIGLVNGHGSNYWAVSASKEELYFTPIDYTYDEYLEPSTWRSGSKIKPLTSGEPRYGYLNDSVQAWGMGALSIAYNLAKDNQYGSISSEIESTSLAVYEDILERINESTTDTWELEYSSNLFVEPVDATTRNVYRYPPTIVLSLTHIQASGSGNGGGAAYTSVNYSGQVPAKVGIFVGRNNPIRYTVGTGIAYTGVLPAIVTTAIKSPTIDSVLSGTNVEIRPGTIALAGEFMQPPRDGVFGIQSDVNWQWRRSNGGFTYTEDPYILSYNLLDPSDITATTVFSASYSGTSPVELDMFIDDTDVRAYSTGPRGRIDWSRRVRTNFEDNPDPDPFTGIPGTYGDPMYDNELEHTDYVTKEQFDVHAGEYYTEEQIISKLGYPSGQTILSPGWKINYWTYMDYDQYVLYGSTYYTVDEENPAGIE